MYETDDSSSPCTYLNLQHWRECEIVGGSTRRQLLLQTTQRPGVLRQVRYVTFAPQSKILKLYFFRFFFLLEFSEAKYTMYLSKIIAYKSPTLLLIHHETMYSIGINDSHESHYNII